MNSDPGSLPRQHSSHASPINPDNGVTGGVSRRQALTTGLAAAGGFLTGGSTGNTAPPNPSTPDPRRRSPKRYPMLKSINQWAFPYPERMSLKECLQLAKDAGFDGIELNYDLDNDLSPKSGAAEYTEIRRMADKIGIRISGLCSFLFWPYPLTHNDPERRQKAFDLALRMIDAARLMETENLLVVPGAVDASWVEDFDPVPNDVCHRRASEGVGKLLPVAAKAGVYLNLENIFVNGFLFSPQEMVAFADSFQSPHARIHFDTGNILQYQLPEDWVRILGKRIKNIHFKEWDKRTHEFNLHTFRTLLDGTTNWPAVIEALDAIGYRDYLTFEYFHPFNHYPEALIYQTSDALDWMLGRKG